MLARSSVKSAVRRFLSAVLAMLLFPGLGGQVRACIPHGSNNGPAIGAATGAGAAGVIIGEIIMHYHISPKKLAHKGPQFPKEFDMSGFAIKGLVRANWPVVLDFMIDSPGSVQIDIIAKDKHRFQATMTDAPNHRGYQIIHLPATFDAKLQTAIYRITSIPAAGANTPAPRLRLYGLGAGEKAVGSVAIEVLKFGPSPIHLPKEQAEYGFYSHSAFDDARADVIFTRQGNNGLQKKIVWEKKLGPIDENAQTDGQWNGKGTPGQHMLRITAWRGLENGGDWVVAWSEDLVDVVK
jgi:hypothetical protein